MKNSLYAIHTWREEAMQLMGEKQYDKAIALLAPVVPFFEQNQAWENYVDAGNNWAEALIGTKQYEEAQQLMQKIVPIAWAKLGDKSELLAMSYYIIGKISQAQTAHDKAINYFQDSLNIYEKNLNPNNAALIADICESMGNTVRIKGMYNMALEYYQKSLAMRLEIFDSKHLKIAHAYNNLSVVYCDKNEIYNAIMYALKSLQLKQQLLGNMDIEIARGYGNLGAFCHKKKEYDKALKCQEESLQIRLQLLGEQHIMIAQTYSNIGLILYRKEQYEQAMAYFSKAIQIILDNYGEKHVFMYYLLVNKSHVFVAEQAYDEAAECLQNALIVCQEKLSQKHPETALLYFLLANIYIQQGNYEKALNYYQLGLQANYDNFNSDDIYHNPPIEGQFSSAILLELLKNKAQCLSEYYQNEATPNPKNIAKALETFYLADELIEQIRHSYMHENAQLSLGEKAFELSENALDAIWQIQKFVK
jgi:tetratricopeptide (TPR) repeat protein